MLFDTPLAPAAPQHALLKRFSRRAIGEGTLLLEEGETGGTFAVVADGTLRASRHLTDDVFANQIEVREGKRCEGAGGVLEQAAVSDFRKAPQTLHDAECVFTPGPCSGATAARRAGPKMKIPIPDVVTARALRAYGRIRFVFDLPVIKFPFNPARAT